MSKWYISTHVAKYNIEFPIGFGNCHHEDTCEIISDHITKDEIQSLTKFKQDSTTIYIYIFYGRHKISLATTCGYQCCGNG